MTSPRATKLLQRRGVQQLIKFCLVGATSTFIDKRTLWFLLNDGLPRAPWWVSATISFCLAVTNGFIWNSRWTFQSRNTSRSTRKQYGMFFTTNVVGLLLNLGLTNLILVMFADHLPYIGGNPHASDVLVASLSAVPIVVLWNFAASKYWTFRIPADGGAPATQ
ncbi:MAG TPA: GtrA family protein [Candidatus Binatia bacterium]|jgi:putative flippase GtrA|nr:GtrA family protein [Candidatus Binatia bacterium]